MGAAVHFHTRACAYTHARTITQALVRTHKHKIFSLSHDRSQWVLVFLSQRMNLREAFLFVRGINSPCSWIFLLLLLPSFCVCSFFLFIFFLLLLFLLFLLKLCVRVSGCVRVCARLDVCSCASICGCVCASRLSHILKNSQKGDSSIPIMDSCDSCQNWNSKNLKRTASIPNYTRKSGVTL